MAAASAFSRLLHWGQGYRDGAPRADDGHPWDD